MNNAITTVWDLNVFQKAYEKSLHLHKITKLFPKEELYGLTSQIRRSSKGICANIGEGFAKQGVSSKEFCRYLLIAIGSSEETKIWLRYCLDLNYINENEYERKS